MDCNAASVSVLFFFNDTATTEIYTLSLHDALPISSGSRHSRDRAPRGSHRLAPRAWPPRPGAQAGGFHVVRSEEHTSELQSQSNLVCRLLLEKKKQPRTRRIHDDCRRCDGSPTRRS